MAQAERAIYLDFEGTKTDPPSLLGSVFLPGRRHVADRRLRYQVDILEHALGPAVDAVVNHGQAEFEARSRMLATAVSDLVGRAEKQDRWLVSWSEREMTAIREAELPYDLATRFDARWVNAIGMAKRWKAIHHPDVVFPKDAAGRRNTLPRFLDLIGYEPSPLGTAVRPADAIRRVRRGLTAKESFQRLRDSQKQQWLGLIAHNFDDCAGMRRVVLCAAAGF